MIPKEKIEQIVARHDVIEKELSSGNLESNKYAQKSKEYSELGRVVNLAREYLNFEKNKLDLDQILNDKKSDKEIF